MKSQRYFIQNRHVHIDFKAFFEGEREINNIQVLKAHKYGKDNELVPINNDINDKDWVCMVDHMIINFFKDKKEQLSKSGAIKWGKITLCDNKQKK